MITQNTIALIRAALDPHKTSYSDAELQQLATTTSGMGEIDPEDARNAIKVREALAALNKSMSQDKLSDRLRAKPIEYMQHKPGCASRNAYGFNPKGKSGVLVKFKNPACNCGFDRAIAEAEALERDRAEPVAWMSPGAMSFLSDKNRKSLDAYNAHASNHGRPPLNEEMFPIPLFTHPPKEAPVSRGVVEAGNEVIRCYRGFHEAIKQDTGKPYPWEPIESAIDAWDAALSSPAPTARVLTTDDAMAAFEDAYTTVALGNPSFGDHVKFSNTMRKLLDQRLTKLMDR